MLGEVSVKHDAEKRRWSLLPTRALEEVVRAFEDGEHKYGRDNWKSPGFAYTRIYDAVFRHLVAWLAGEDCAQDSNVHHLAHAAANLLFLIEYFYSGEGVDDR